MRWMQTYSWTETQVFQNIDTHSIKIDEFAEDWNLVDGLDSFGAYVLIPWFLPTIRQFKLSASNTLLWLGRRSSSGHYCHCMWTHLSANLQINLPVFWTEPTSGSLFMTSGTRPGPTPTIPLASQANVIETTCWWVCILWAVLYCFYLRQMHERRFDWHPISSKSPRVTRKPLLNFNAAPRSL